MKKLIILLMALAFIMPDLLGEPVTITLGSATTSNLYYQYPTPYGTYLSNHRVQYLVLSNELATLGLAPGNITAIGFNVANVNNCLAMPNYTMKIKFTDANELTTTFDNGPDYIIVWQNTSFLPQNGWNTHTFTTPVYWNGTSNLLIDVCFDRIFGYSQNASVYYTETATNLANYYIHFTNTACGTNAPATISKNRANMQITGELASCRPPSELTITDVTDHTVQIDWEPAGSENSWNLAYGVKGFNPRDEGEVFCNVTYPFPLEELIANIEYDIYIQSVCNSESKELSLWAGPFTFRTLCEAFSLPFNEDFTEVTYGSLPDCWSVIGEGLDNWWVQDSDEAGGIVPEMQFNGWPEIDGTSRLITPSIATGGAGKFMISFRQYLYDENEFSGEYIAVEYSIDDGNNWEEIWHYDCDASMAPTLTEFIFEIPAKSDELLIAFKFNGNSNNIYYWCIDNIVIEVAPTCIRPTALTASDINHSSAKISWTPLSGETAWNLKYGPLGFDPDTQGNSVDVFVTHSCSISGLDSNTPYDVYVRAVCDEEDVSAWSVKKTFRTLCDPVNLPYTENFDNVMAPDIPDCMTVTDKYGFGIWATWHTIEWLSRSEPNCMAMSHEFSVPLDEWFFSPGLNLTGGNTYIVEFYYFLIYEIYIPEIFEVKWGTAPNAVGMTSERIWYDEDFMDEDFVLATAVFTPEEDGVYFVGWHASSDINYGLSIYVDDIFIDLAPTCPKPIALTVSNITANSAEIDWTKGGNEAMWNLKYYKVGLGDTVLINNIEKPFTCSDLTPNTNYAFMIQADCGDGDVSMWSVMKTFVTLCEAISDLPWTESFENVTISDLPVCWLNEGGMWHTANNDDSPYDANARTGEQFLREYFLATNSYIWTPGFAVQAGKTYEFSFWWAGDGYSNWTGDVFFNHFQTSENATHIANFVQSGTYTTKIYAQFLYSFVPESDDIYYFAIKISSSWPAKLISFDDFEFKAIQTGPVPTLHISGPQLSGCKDALELITITNAQVEEGIDVEYRAGETINATGFTVEANAMAYLYAGENIVLGQGVHVAQGADFLATIMDPVTYCQQAATMVTAKSEEIAPAVITPAEKDAMFTIFPNPTTGRFTLMMKEADDTSVINVEIFGLMGERVLQTQLFGQNWYEFDLSGSPKGVYIVRLLSGKQTSIKKLIKQ